jgi:hypothetical protein
MVHQSVAEADAEVVEELLVVQLELVVALEDRDPEVVP